MLSLLIIFFLIAIVTSFLCSLWEAVLLSITPSYAQIKVQEGGALGRRLQAFKEKLIHITSLLEMPLLSEYGLDEAGIQKVVDCTSHKNHPVRLTNEQMVSALKVRI